MTPKPRKHILGHKYRKCRKCNDEYNVSMGSINLIPQHKIVKLIICQIVFALHLLKAVRFHSYEVIKQIQLKSKRLAQSHNKTDFIPKLEV